MAEGQKKKIFDGRYDILSIVGRGACSVVYHARHISPPAGDIALKVLLNKNGERANGDRLRKEALAMVSSRHRYVIRLDDFHSVGDLCYLSMEYAPESDARKFAARTGGKLAVAQAERFLLQAAEALGFIHRAGIIHRDIKPDNILVINSNEIRLGDFGVAVLPGEESSLDELQRGVGTMDYMAPEVLEGIRYDQRADVYALAVTFYELISGKHPFGGLPLIEQLAARKDGAIPPLSTLAPEVPQYLSSVIMKGMSYSEEQRYSTGRELLQALLVAKAEAPTSAPSAPGKPAIVASAEQKPKAPQSSAPKAAKAAAPAGQSATKRPEAKPAISPAKTQEAVPAAKVANAAPASAAEAKDTPGKPRLAPLTPNKRPAAKAPAAAAKPVSTARPAKAATPKAAPSAAPVAERSRPAPTAVTPTPVTEPAPQQIPPVAEEPTPMPAPEDDVPVRPGNSLPGIGLKREAVSPSIPVKSSSGVLVKEGPRRETVAVSAAEVLAARKDSQPQESTERPTVSLAADRSSTAGTGAPSGTASSGVTDTLNDELSSISPLDAEPNKLPPDAAPGRPTETIKGFQGKLKKVPAPGSPKSTALATNTRATPAPSRMATGISPDLRKRVAFAAIAIGVLLAASTTLLGGAKSSHRAKPVDASTTQQIGESFSNPDSVTPIPAVSAESLAFPNLPEGLYNGTMSGLAPGRTPLTMISHGERKQISVLVGVPGWTGVITDMPEPPKEADAPNPPLRVSSNGIILEMTGEIVEGNINGYYRNLVTGEQGEWHLSPVRGGG